MEILHEIEILNSQIEALSVTFSWIQGALGTDPQLVSPIRPPCFQVLADLQNRRDGLLRRVNEKLNPSRPGDYS